MHANINYSISWLKYLLIPLGLWPSSSRRMKYFDLCCIAFVYFMLIAMFMTVYLHLTAEAENSIVKIDNTGPMSFMVMNVLKMSSLLLQVKNIKHFINIIRKDWVLINGSHEQTIMLNGAKRSRYICFGSIAFMFSGLLMYHGLIPLSVYIINYKNHKYVNPLCYPVYSKFFDIKKNSTMFALFVLQNVVSMIECNIGVSMICMIVVFVTHVCSQLEIVMLQLSQLLDEKDLERTEKKISAIIKLHQKTTRYIPRWIDQSANIL